MSAGPNTVDSNMLIRDGESASEVRVVQRQKARCCTRKNCGVCMITFVILCVVYWAVWEGVCSGYPTVDPSTPSGTCAPWVVPFYHVGKHTFFTLPTCTTEFDRDKQEPDLNACSRCAPAEYNGSVARVNWNIDYCTWNVCFNGSKHEVTPQGITGFLPAPGLPMHPKCAWGMARLLNATYDNHQRHVGPTAPFAVPPRCDKFSFYFWFKNAMLLLKYGGATNNYQNDALMTINWNIRLSNTCKNDLHSKEDILSPKFKKAICWTWISDYRDLYCHYKPIMDVNDPVACDKEFPETLDIQAILA